jgi:hypothetical protein
MKWRLKTRAINKTRFLKNLIGGRLRFEEVYTDKCRRIGKRVETGSRLPGLSLDHESESSSREMNAAPYRLMPAESRHGLHASARQVTYPIRNGGAPCGRNLRGSDEAIMRRPAT